MAEYIERKRLLRKFNIDDMMNVNGTLISLLLPQLRGEDGRCGMNDVSKEPFRFEYTMPALDWYEIRTVEINYDDYVYFELQRRYGQEWWLMGKNPPPKNSDDYRWTSEWQ